MVVVDRELPRVGKEWTLLMTGQLERVRVGEVKVITPRDSRRYVGASPLTEFAAVGISSPDQVAGVTTVSFFGVKPEEWYDHLAEYADQLVSLGKRSGGADFTAFFVNVRTGNRNPDLNELLGQNALRWAEEQLGRDLVAFEFVTAEAFCIDRVTGALSPL